MENASRALLTILLLGALSIASGNCTSALARKGTLPADPAGRPPGRLVVTVENQNKDRSGNIRFYLSRTLPTNLEDPDETMELVWKGEIAEGIPAELELPPGRYYAKIVVSDLKVRPLLFSDFSHFKIQFGFTEKIKYRTWRKNQISAIPYNDQVCSIKNSYLICPQMSIRSGESSRLKFVISDQSRYDSGGTALIWLSILGFAIRGLPVPTPLFTGPIALKRTIETNIQTPNRRERFLKEEPDTLVRQPAQ